MDGPSLHVMNLGNHEPELLGFGAFETTAFVTSVIVALYSLISNPTGRQRATDQSEYQVYAAWRLGLIAIAAQLHFMLIVILQLTQQSSVPINAKVWLTLLMISPWAPLAGTVRDTLTAAPRVRRMMRTRLTRNELAALLRDRFKFGQRSIALPLVRRRMHPNFVSLSGTTPPLDALRQCTLLAPYELVLCEQAMHAAQTEQRDALALGALWSVSQGSQPTALTRWHLRTWAVTGYLDVLARAWTTNSVTLAADCMPEVRTTRERARLLDVVDSLQQGGTVSDTLTARALRGRFCERCMLATRAAVEAFLESSERGHTDMRARVWVRDLDMNWQGGFERIMDVMWEATFIENTGQKVDYADDRSRDFGDRAKVTTTKMMALLFLLARSVMYSGVEESIYKKVAEIMDAGPFRGSWWVRFWVRLGERLQTKKPLSGSGNFVISIGDGIRAEFKATLRDIIDEDMASAVEHFVENPIRDSVCSCAECRLRGAKLIFTRCV